MAPALLLSLVASWALGLAAITVSPVALSSNEAGGEVYTNAKKPSAKALHDLRSGGPPTATPLGKVVELLDILEKQLDEEGQADANSYAEFVTWYHNASFVANSLIKETSGNIETLKSGIDEKDAFITGEGRRLDRVAGELASGEKELKEASTRRKSENKAFKASEATLVDAVDSLQRSLEVLGASADPGTSLAAVAKNLRAALLQDTSLHLSASQKATLDGFFRAGSASEDGRASARYGDSVAEGMLAPEFLQVRSSQQGDPTKSSVVSTLQSVLEKSQKELNEIRTTEAAAKSEFDTFATNLNQQIENKKKTISEIRTQTSHAQQAKSQFESQLSQSQKTLKVTQAELVEVETVNRKKTAAFKERTSKRSDEIMAVREATQLLTSDAAKKLLDTQDSGDDSSPASFLQTAQTRSTKRKALNVLRYATEPQLALSALQVHQHASSHTRSSHAHRTDPFGKVKSLIRDMLQKLQEEHSAESEKKAWCDKELAENTKVQTSKQDAITKLSDRIGVMDAELAELVDKIKTTTEDLAQLETSTAMATKVREQEKTVAEAAIQQYKDAQELIKAAIDVLQKFYQSKSGTRAPGEQKTKSTGLGGGVVGILEIAVADYGDLQKESESAEAEASGEYKELMSETEVRKAVFEKDLEYAKRGKARLEAERSRTSADVKNYEKELQTVEEYLAKVKGTCVAKVASYDERQSRRQAELKSLREARDFLVGE